MNDKKKLFLLNQTNNTICKVTNDGSSIYLEFFKNLKSDNSQFIDGEVTIGQYFLSHSRLNLYFKKLAKSKSVSYFKGKKIIINKFECNHAHIDGEPMLLKSSSSIELVADGLTIIK